MQSLLLLNFGLVVAYICVNFPGLHIHNMLLDNVVWSKSEEGSPTTAIGSYSQLVFVCICIAIQCIISVTLPYSGKIWRALNLAKWRKKAVF